jgi:putative DNA-invertase from lambdoid prophage Rac
VGENISGSVAAAQRPAFAKLLDRLEDGDVLVVTKLDRLGRNALDVRSTVERLASMGVKVHCLVLGGFGVRLPVGLLIISVLRSPLFPAVLDHLRVQGISPIFCRW